MQNPNLILPDPIAGKFVKMPVGYLYDPATEAQKFLEAASALKQAKINAEAAVQKMIQEQADALALMFADINAALAANDATNTVPNLRAAVQPILDSAASQFPDIMAAITTTQQTQ